MSTKRKVAEEFTQSQPKEHDIDQYLTEEVHEKQEKQVLKKKKPTQDLIKSIHRIFKTDETNLLDFLREHRHFMFACAKSYGLLCIGVEGYIKKGDKGVESLLKYMKESFELGCPIVGISYSKSDTILKDRYPEGWDKLEINRLLLKKSDYWYYVFNNIQDAIEKKEITAPKDWNDLKKLVAQCWDNTTASDRRYKHPDDKEKQDVQRQCFKDDDFNAAFNHLVAFWNGEAIEYKKPISISMTKKKFSKE